MEKGFEFYLSQWNLRLTSMPAGNLASIYFKARIVTLSNKYKKVLNNFYCKLNLNGALKYEVLHNIIKLLRDNILSK